jgi:hypothetical protein
MNVKRIVLLVLLIVLLAVISYQIVHIDSRKNTEASIKKSRFSKERSQSQLRLEDREILRINLNKLNQKRTISEDIERNLFVIDHGKARQDEVAALREEQGELEEEDQNYEEEVSPIEKTDLKLQYFRNVKYIGLGIIREKRIAGVVINGYLYLGLEGDVIANRFTILKVTDKFLEISIVKDNISQKIYLESG